MLYATAGQGWVFVWMAAAGALIAAWYGVLAGLRRLLAAGFWLSLAADVAFSGYCGAEGDETEVIRPSERHPEHWYQVLRFYTDDAERMNLYNLAIMHDKGHDIAQYDAELGWRYVRRFRRKADGSLEIAQE